MGDHVMVDLETLGTGHDACILSIGAAKFDPYGDGVKESFHVPVDPASCQQHGLKIEAGTVLWWLAKERADARDALLDWDYRIDLPSALDAFSQWIGGDLPVWGNGATFDNAILRTAYEKTGLECPWKFWNDRCYRTVKNLWPNVPLLRTGTHHAALDDAVSQARHLQALMKAGALHVIESN